MIGLAVAGVLAATVALAASLLAGRGARGGLGQCLAGQLGALVLRLAGLAGIALLLHLRWPGELLVGLAVAVIVLLVGLALDARRLLRTVRAPTEERFRA